MTSLTTGSRTRTTFECASCGAPHPSWVGRCGSCGDWNALVEVPVVRSGGSSVLAAASLGIGEARPLSTLAPDESAPLPTATAHPARALSGGPVPGSAPLLGVDPGAEGFDNGPCAGNVTAITEAMDGRLPIGQGCQHQHPVGDGLVARHPGSPPERASGLHDHWTSHHGGAATRRGIHARGAVVGRYPLAIRPPPNRSDCVASTIRPTTPPSPPPDWAPPRP